MSPPEDPPGFEILSVESGGRIRRLRECDEGAMARQYLSLLEKPQQEAVPRRAPLQENQAGDLPRRLVHEGLKRSDLCDDGSLAFVPGSERAVPHRRIPHHELEIPTAGFSWQCPQQCLVAPLERPLRARECDCREQCDCEKSPPVHAHCRQERKETRDGGRDAPLRPSGIVAEADEEYRRKSPERGGSLRRPPNPVGLSACSPRGIVPIVRHEIHHAATLFQASETAT